MIFDPVLPELNWIFGLLNLSGITIRMEVGLLTKITFWSFSRVVTPESIVHKNIFWRFVFLWVNLALLNPTESFSWRCRVVQATKNKEESCSFLDAIGRRSCGPLSGLGKHVGKPKLRLKRIETAGRYTLRCALSLSSDLHFNSRSNLCKFCSISDALAPPPPLSLSPCGKTRKKNHFRRINSTISTSKRKFAKCGHQVQVSRAPTASMQWLIQNKNAELFPATPSCVLCISNDLRRVAALGNYMLSDETFVHSVWLRDTDSDLCNERAIAVLAGRRSEILEGCCKLFPKR